MILESSSDDLAAIARRLGWELKPEGLCRDDVCVPLGDRSGARGLADALRRPFVDDIEHDLAAIGPETGRAINSAVAPDLVLPDWEGRDFSLRSLLGKKVLIVAWAPW